MISALQTGLTRRKELFLCYKDVIGKNTNI